jgi:hypothetical protein
MFNLDYKNVIAKDCGNLTQVSNDMYITPFWKESFCKDLVDYFNKNSYVFTNKNSDGYGTSEASVSYISNIFTLNILKQHYEKILLQMFKTYVNLNSNGYFVPYFLRYNHKDDTVNSLKLHNDLSGISSLLKINNDFKGGETVFPRQNIDTKDMPIGHILVWPGQVTHPHKVNPVTDGIKYSLSIVTLPVAWANQNVVPTNEILEFLNGDTTDTQK